MITRMPLNMMETGFRLSKGGRRAVKAESSVDRKAEALTKRLLSIVIARQRQSTAKILVIPQVWHVGRGGSLVRVVYSRTMIDVHLAPDKLDDRRVARGILKCQVKGIEFAIDRLPAPPGYDT